jgi:hypothetical protein
MSATGVVEQHLGQKRETLLARLAAARANTDQLFSLVHPEALYDRPIAERHRLIFYVGHLEAFDWNLIATGTLGVAASRPTLDNLFAFGIDPVGGNLPNDPAERPARRLAVAGASTRLRPSHAPGVGSTPGYVRQPATSPCGH